MNQLFRTLVVLSSMFLAASGFANQLAPMTAFGTNGDGTIRPGDVSFLNNDGSRSQRGMAYNPTTGHLIVVNRFPIGSETINIIDAATGTNVGTLDVCCPTFGGSSSFIYNMVGVADDGAIYVGNLTTSGTLVTFNLYRWANEAGSQNLVYSGDPRNGNPATGNTRWGDVLAVRGSGINTEILIAPRTGSLAALLRPTDGTMASFTATTLSTAVSSGGLSYGLAFGPGNTFYGREASAEGSPLYHMSYDANAGTGVVLHVFSTTAFPGRVGPIAVNVASNQLAAIEMTAGTNADIVRLYDISNPNVAPSFVDRRSVPVWTNANSIFSGALAFGQGNVYGLNSDNGIAAFSIASGTNLLAPQIFGDPASQLTQLTSNAVFTVGVDGATPLSYQWLFYGTNVANQTNATLSLTNLQVANAGNYSVLVTNAYGSATSAVAVLTVLPNFGNLLVYDPFAYTVGSIIAGQGGWSATSSDNGTNGSVEAGNLVVPGLAQSIGSRYTWGANQSIRKPFGQYSAGEVYASFAFRLDTVPSGTANETMAGFSFGTSTTFPLKINILHDGTGGYQFGVYKGGGTTGNGSIDATHTFHQGDTVFVVVRYKFNAGVNADTCDLWINPDSSSFGTGTAPTATIAAVGTGVSQSTWSFIDRFFLRWASGGYTKRVADEVRVGFSWAEVTPAAPPSLAIALTGNSAVLSWSTNATGYVLESNLKVDDSGGWEAVGAPVVVQGGNNTATVSISGKKFFRLKK